MKFFSKVIGKIKQLLFSPKLKLHWKSSTYIFSPKEMAEIDRVVNENLKIKMNTLRIEGDYIYNWYKG